MSKVVVMGLVNRETTIKVPKLPMEHIPILYHFFGMESMVSGNGYNVSKAMRVLGDDIRLLTMTGDDDLADIVEKQLERDGISKKYLKKQLKETPESVVFYDCNGRQIFCDLKDSQEQEYDKKTFLEAAKDVDLLYLGNVNFSRPLLQEAKKTGILIATDVSAITSAEDEYNREFMEVADILFVSDDFVNHPMELLDELKEKYNAQIIIIGRGVKGALLYVKKDQFIGEFPSVKTRKVVNTLGAGDAMFSAFLHFYLKNQNPYYAIKNAILFASYKIGTVGSANGFLSEKQIEQFFPLIWK